MSVFSKTIESIIKSFSKEASRNASEQASKNANKNANKQALESSTHNATKKAMQNNAIMPNQNPQRQGMQDTIKDFGTNYTEFKGKGQEAIKHLLKVKNGQVQGAFYRDDLGEITLLWGEVTNPKKNEGYGLAHILDKRTREMGEQKALEFIHNIPDIIKNAQLKQDDKGRIKLENKNVIIGIKDNWKGQKTPHWIVTSYELKNTKGESGSLYTSPLDDISEILPKTPFDNSTTKQNKKQESNKILPFNRK
ncbi:putative barnase/colicin E5 family endoribonuclease [Helicobacter sp. T3_23-1059]